MTKSFARFRYTLPKGLGGSPSAVESCIPLAIVVVIDLAASLILSNPHIQEALGLAFHPPLNLFLHIGFIQHPNPPKDESKADLNQSRPPFPCISLLTLKVSRSV